MATFYVVRCCPVCGWWNVCRGLTASFLGETHEQERGNAGVLKRLDVSDQRVPLAAVRSYLAARYNDRFSVNPRVFENVVASVYADLGYDARVTGQTGDGGIDIILDGPGQATIGVQVKRYRNKIEVEQIHSLAGALIHKRLTRGVFVTTSTYRRGAQVAAAELTELGIPIELVDAKRFFEALGLSQRRVYETVDDPLAPFIDAPLLDLKQPDSIQSRTRPIDLL